MTAAPPARPRKKPAGRFHHGDLAEQLAVAAGALVERRGHASFSMKELAARLGVTEPAIYRHYDGRDALLAEVALRGFLAFAAALEEDNALATDAFDSVRRYGRAYVRFCVAHPGWFRLQFSRTWSEELGRRPDVAPRLAAANEARARLLERWKAALPPDEAHRVADLYRLAWATTHGLAGFIVERVFQLVQTDEERLAAADAAIELFVDSLRSRATASAAYVDRRPSG